MMMENHYNETHWNQKIQVGKFFIFPCGISHASVRLSTIRATHGTHYHCPHCPGGFSAHLSVDLLREHLVANHAKYQDSSHFSTNDPTEGGWTYIDSLCAINDAASAASNDVSPSGYMAGRRRSVPRRRVDFDTCVLVREFSLACSIIEQAGGRSESRQCKHTYDSFVPLHVIEHLASFSIENLGANNRSLKLFSNFFFVLCGVDIPSSVIAGITSLGGIVSGANYAESTEWEKVTHVLLGNRISQKSVRILKRNVPLGILENLEWVSSDWIKKCVETGRVFGVRQIFSPAAIDRFFSVREANARTERRKSLRARPDIPTIPREVVMADTVTFSGGITQRISSPTVSFDESPPTDGPSMTPEGGNSPQSVSVVPPQRGTERAAEVANVLQPLPPADNYAAGLRRSKRLSVIGVFSGSGRFSSMIHTIKKPAI